MGFSPPNSKFSDPGSNRGMSRDPIAGIPTGRGAAPTGDRFELPDPTAAWPPAATDPGQGQIAITPGAPTGPGLPIAIMRPAR